MPDPVSAPPDFTTGPVLPSNLHELTDEEAETWLEATFSDEALEALDDDESAYLINLILGEMDRYTETHGGEIPSFTRALLYHLVGYLMGSRSLVALADPEDDCPGCPECQPDPADDLALAPSLRGSNPHGKN